MKLFLSDLDNTLIYSYKRDIGTEKVLVETKDEKELSFMSIKSSELLCELQKKMNFMPLTTRSIEQYQRIVLSTKWSPTYALAANGGVLLHSGEVVKDWYDESKRLISSAEDSLEIGMKLLNKDKNVYFKIQKVDGLFVFTKSRDVIATLSILRENLDITKVLVFNNGSKIYVVPKILNKGFALERIKKLQNIDFIIAAGDSIFDVPMLALADLALAPSALKKEFDEPNEICFFEGTNLFSDELLQKILGSF